jgi:hypothetical protein
MIALDAAIGIAANAWRGLSAVAAFIRPPLRVEVRELVYEDLTSRPSDVVIVATAEPQRYRVVLRVVNRASRPIFIEAIRLQIETETPIPIASTVTRLAPDEPAEIDVRFPLQAGRSPWESGTFVLFVVPTRGRAARFRGRFPILRGD